MGMFKAGLGLLAGAFIASSLLAPVAHAQVDKLEIIAPANPGSGYDQTARAVQQALTQSGLVGDVQVVNVPGAGATIGLAQFVTSRKRSPSALMIAFSMIGSIITNKSPVSLDQVDPLARLIREDLVLVVPANSEIKTAPDLVAKFKADPASVIWAQGNVGGVDHVLTALIAKSVGIDPKQLKTIHYSGGGEQVAAVVGGHVTVAAGGVPEFAAQVASGSLRAIAVASEQRLAGVDAPTLKEQGIDVGLSSWRGMLVKKDMPEEQRQGLSDAVAKLVKTPEWEEQRKRFGWEDAYLPSAEFATFIKEQDAVVSGTLKELGLAQ